MTIAYLINHPGVSGVNNVVFDLVSQFQSCGHQCVVYCLEERGEAMDFPCSVRKMDESIYQADVIHAHGLAPMLWVSKHKRRLKQRGNASPKLITTLHCYCWQDFADTYSPLKGALLSLLFLFSARAFDKIVCLSRHMQHYYRGKMPARKLTYAYNTRMLSSTETLSAEEQQQLERFKGNDILIGMNCVLLLRKGIDVMLKALALLPQHYKLWIVGDGKEADNFKQLAAQLSLQHRVCFAGHRPQAHRYLPFYDIYTLPSRSEGFPLSLLEAAIYAKKVVASKLPIVQECFNEREIATFSMPSEQELAAAIIAVTSDDAIGERLKARFQSTYSPQSFYQNYLRIYQEA